MTLTSTQSYIMYSVILIMTYVFVSIDERYKIRITKTKYLNSLFSILIFLVMFLILTFRNCGTDTPTYEYMFIHNLYESDYDIVFFGLQRLIRRYTDNILVWQGVIGGVSLLGVLASSERLKDIVDRRIYLLFSSVYLYFFMFNYSRMMMSIGVLVFGMSYLVTGDYRKYIVFNVIAGLIHYTSFAVLLLFAVYYLGRNHRRILITLGIIGALLIRIRPDIVGIFVVSEHYSYYITDGLSAGNGIGTILQILPYFFMLIYFRKNINKNIITLMYILLIANLAFGFLGYAIPVASRIARFTFAFPCMFIPAYLTKCTKEAKSNNSLLIKWISMVWSAVVYFGLVQTTFETIGIIPYISR